MSGGAGDDYIYVDDANDKVIEAAGGGHDTILSAIAFDLGVNGANVEDLRLGATAAIGYGNALDNALYAYQGVASTLAGVDGNDKLYGSTASDTLIGGNGDDLLQGNGGTDTMSGGAGNDTYAIDSLADQVLEQANGGVDTVVSDVDNDINHLLAANVENLTLTINAFIGYGNGLDNVISVAQYSASNYLYGLGGKDTLIGAEGNDHLDGGTGADSLKGGAGNDIYYVDDAGDTVIEAANGGTDEVDSSIDYTLAANVENLYLTGTGNITGAGNSGDNQLFGTTGDNKLDGGAGNDRLYGDDGNDTLTGGAGDDTLSGQVGTDTLDGGAGRDWLDGGTGADVMTGGAGDDLYFVDDANDVVIELANQGLDAIIATVSFDLALKGANVENLELDGSSNLTGNGNALANQLSGNDGNNTLNGQGGNDILIGDIGNDTLIGGAGDDVLSGGPGTDAMTGGDGNDAYYVDNTGDTVTELANGGHDLITLSGSLLQFNLLTAGANVEDLSLEIAIGNATGIGNDLDNAITGSTHDDTLDGGKGSDKLYGAAGNDSLDGGTGNDAMTGGIGDDTYYVDSAGDKVTEAANGGHDTVHALLAHYTLGANLEDLVFDDTAGAATGTGNALDNDIKGTDSGGDTLDGGAGNDTLHGQNGLDHLIGNTGDDYLDGGNQADILEGGAGNDVLAGGTGADSMTGGAGNDIYFVDDANDKVTEQAGQGTDTVITQLDFDLSAHGSNVENLVLIGTDTGGTGNALDNVISGSSTNNAIDGGAGNDTLRGYDGNDTLSGGSGNDVLEGGLGADTLDGGAGNDVFRYELANTVNLSQLGGDTINNFETGKDKIDVHDLFTEFNIPQGGDPFADGTLTLQVTGGNTLVRFDADGSVGNAYTPVTLVTVHSATLVPTDVVF